MPAQHHCIDGCFNNKTTMKQITNCFACERRCNLKCHGITSNPVVAALSSDSNAVFICTLCYHKLSKSELSKRRSTNNSSMAIRTAPSSDQGIAINRSPMPCSLSNAKDNANDKANEKIIELLNHLLKSTNDNSQMINANLTGLMEIAKEPKIIENTCNPTQLNNIFTEVTKNSYSLSKLVTMDQFKLSVSNICSSIEKKTDTRARDSLPNSPANSQNMIKSLLSNKFALQRNALDWSTTNDSFNIDEDTDGRPSISITHSIDDSVVDLVKNSELTTWNSFDLLFNEVKLLSNKLDEIKSTVTPLTNYNNTSQTNVRSPLVESIIHDTLDKILTELADLKLKSTFNQSITQPKPLPQSTQTLEEETLDALHKLEIESNSHASDTSPTEPSTRATSPTFSALNVLAPPFDRHNSLTGNPLTVDKPKEPMSHSNNSNIILNPVPESYNLLEQKRQMPSPPGEGSGNERIAPNMSSLSRVQSPTQILEAQVNAMSEILSNNSDPCITTTNALLDSSSVDLTPSSCVSSTENINANRPTLDAFTSPPITHEFHLTNLDKSVTTDMVIHFLRCKGISDTPNMRVTSLTSRNRDASKISFASFKIDTTDEIAKIISNHDFWPPNSIFKNFIQKRRLTATFNGISPASSLNNNHFLTMNRQGLN